MKAMHSRHGIFISIAHICTFCIIVCTLTFFTACPAAIPGNETDSTQTESEGETDTTRPAQKNNLSQAIAQISSLGASGGTVRLTGNISSSDIRQIKSALQKLGTLQAGQKGITLILSDTKGLTSIDNEAFANCAALTSISLPAGIKRIGDGAFYKSGLTSIVIPSGVTAIGDFAFASATELASVTLPQTVKTIGRAAFNAAAFTSIRLPEGITRIEDYTFYGVTRLTTVTTPSTLTYIGAQAFGRCIGLKEIIIQKSSLPLITLNGKEVFSGCTWLSSIRVPSSRLSAYKTAPVWSYFAGKIKPLS